jgi:membrane protein
MCFAASSANLSDMSATRRLLNKTYGSLGGVIGSMIWIWLSIIVILLGAELNAEAEHQSARDTTTGAAKPIGSRNAKMADTLGARK